MGGLIRNETLTLSTGNYMANATIIIAGGGCLIIGANSNINFAPGRGILVSGSGKLTIEGPSLLDTPNPQAPWAGIVLGNSNRTVISNTLINNTEIGVRVRSCSSCEEDSNSSPPFLSIKNSKIEKASSDGIRLEITTSTVMLSNVHIESPGQHGLYAASFQGNLIVTDSTISSTNYALYSDYASEVQNSLLCVLLCSFFFTSPWGMCFLHLAIYATGHTYQHHSGFHFVRGLH